MADGGPTVHLTYDSARGSVSSSKSGDGYTITVEIKPRSGYAVRMVSMRCDAGQTYNYDYHSASTVTYTTGGHTDCRDIYFDITLLPVGSVLCAFTVSYSSSPAMPIAGALATPPIEWRYGSPSDDGIIFSPTVTPTPGWEVYAYEGYITGESRDARWSKTEYNPPRRSAFQPSFRYSTHSKSHSYSETYEHEGNFTFWARKITFTLTYDANGGTVEPETAQRVYDDAIGILPTPKRSGYNFDGWYTSSSGGDKVDASTPMGASDRTIYAHWRELSGRILHDPTSNQILFGASGSILYEG